MFIDYVTLMLINMSAGLFILAYYVLHGIIEADQRKWAIGFGMVGLAAIILGLNMTLKWPLPGSYNVAFGELSILFGTVFFASSIALAKNWSISVITVYAFFAGLVSVIVGASFIKYQLSEVPILAGVGFIITGLGGMFAYILVKLREYKFLRILGALSMFAAGIIWAFIGYFAYVNHVKSFQKWVPVQMETSCECKK